MATPTPGLQMVELVLLQLLLLAACAYLLTLRPRPPALTVLGLWLASTAFQSISNYDLVARYTVTWPPRLAGEDLWIYLGVAIVYASTSLVIVFCALTPTPVRIKSWEGAAVVAMLAFELICFTLWVTRTWSDDVDYYVAGPFALPHYASQIASVVLSLRRARGLDAVEGRAHTTILAATQGLGSFQVGHWWLQLFLTPMGVHFASQFTVQSDWWTRNHAWNVFFLLGFLILLVAFLRRRVWFPVYMIAGGTLWFFLYQIQPYPLLGLSLAVVALVPIYVTHTTGYLGVKSERALAGWLAAGAGAITALFLTILLANFFAASSPAALVFLTLAGVALAIALFLLLRPRHAPLSLTLDPDRGLRVRTTPGRQRATEGSLAPGDVVAERYRIERLLGEGGQGRTYLAHDERDERSVVLKALAAGTEPARAASEARKLGAARSPHIAELLGVEVEGGATYLVMEYVEGQSLRALLARRGALAHHEADEIAAQLLAGLGDAHARGIVHGDVKPENILVSPKGVVKLVDFGSARDLRPEATVVQAPSGTLLYMSPEQVRGQPPTIASDVHAAGLVYAEMLSGAPVRSAGGHDDFGLRAMILQSEPALSGLDDARAAIVRHAIARDPAARFADAVAMRDAVRAFAA